MNEVIKAGERTTISWIVELLISLPLVAGGVYSVVKQQDRVPLVVAVVGVYILHHAFTPAGRSYRVETKYKGDDEAEG